MATSILHEGIVALVRERPGFAAELLRQIAHVSVPPFTEAQLVEASLNDLVPTEYRADAVVLFVEDAPVFGVIVEAQLGRDPAVASAAAVGASQLPEPLRMLCFALIESSLGDAARKSFEMLPKGQQFMSETQRQGFAQGEARGEARGRAQAVLRVLDRRGVVVPREQRERILACSDPATLDRWLDAAVTAASIEELS